jgi:hypothetical protein
MRPDEREVLERAVRRVTEQAANAEMTVDQAMAVGLDGSDKIVVSTKMLRAELLSVEADLERELEKVVLDWPSVGSASTRSAVSACGLVIGHTRNPRRTRRRSSPADFHAQARASEVKLGVGSWMAGVTS